MKIPNTIRRRLVPGDLEKIDKIFHEQYRYFLFNVPFNIYSELIIRETINMFVQDFKLGDIDYNYESAEDEENKLYEIWWELIPYLQSKYNDLLKKKYDYGRKNL
jgi:hypothetical protein